MCCFFSPWFFFFIFLCIFYWFSISPLNLDLWYIIFFNLILILLILFFILLPRLHIYHANPGWLRPLFLCFTHFCFSKCYIYKLSWSFFVIKNNTFTNFVFFFIYIFLENNLLNSIETTIQVVDFFLFKMLTWYLNIIFFFKKKLIIAQTYV
jgi:hypothetical protein